MSAPCRFRRRPRIRRRGGRPRRRGSWRSRCPPWRGRRQGIPARNSSGRRSIGCCRPRVRSAGSTPPRWHPAGAMVRRCRRLRTESLRVRGRSPVVHRPPSRRPPLPRPASKQVLCDTSTDGCHAFACESVRPHQEHAFATARKHGTLQNMSHGTIDISRDLSSRQGVRRNRTGSLWARCRCIMRHRGSRTGFITYFCAASRRDAAISIPARRDCEGGGSGDPPPFSYETSSTRTPSPGATGSSGGDWPTSLGRRPGVRPALSSRVRGVPSRPWPRYRPERRCSCRGSV